MNALGELALQHRFAELGAPFHCPTRIQALQDAHVIHINSNVQKLLGLKSATAKELESYADYFGGGKPMGQARPIATAYAGHQFGIFVSQLGDGRVSLLGEARGTDGQSYELGLKGSGATDFSRGGDGRAVLRSTIREYLCGEAMHALGIPSTRGLAIIGSSTPVQRETLESAAVLARIARTHIRFGHFEYYYYRHEHKHVKRLADFVLEQYFPDLKRDDEGYVELYRSAVKSTARMIAGWQAMGFAHGVMNTDNMSILGETLDYGPYGFMERFDPQWICNHSDVRGRYAWNRQPTVGLWNLAALGQALSKLIDEKTLKESLSEYEAELTRHWLSRMQARMGLLHNEDGDMKLLTDWLDMLQQQQCDYHRSFRALNTLAEGEHGEQLDACPHRDERFEQWCECYRARLERENQSVQRRTLMENANPLYVLRNYLAHQAITRATEEGDYSEIERLLTLMQSPYREVTGSEQYTQSAPDWAHDLELSCSS